MSHVDACGRPRRARVVTVLATGHGCGCLCCPGAPDAVRRRSRCFVRPVAVSTVASGVWSCCGGKQLLGVAAQGHQATALLRSVLAGEIRRLVKGRARDLPLRRNGRLAQKSSHSPTRSPKQPARRISVSRSARDLHRLHPPTMLGPLACRDVHAAHLPRPPQVRYLRYPACSTVDLRR